DRFGNLEVVNDIIRDNLFYSKQQKKGKSATLNFLFGNEGPVWYRGMVKRNEKYSPITEVAVRKIKKRYDVEHIIVGHTVMDEVSEFFKGSVTAVNVDNEKNAFENKSRGLMLIKNSRYAVYNDTFSEL
ncbi:MAG: metallophosphatase, partial [Bacteroidales bacterium]|nr:metallophosphatase [Bacteroidales bacterium]